MEFSCYAWYKFTAIESWTSDWRKSDFVLMCIGLIFQAAGGQQSYGQQSYGGYGDQSQANGSQAASYGQQQPQGGYGQQSKYLFIW